MHTTSVSLMSSAEACRHLAIDRSTLSRWVQLGKIHEEMKAPGVRGPRFFHPDEVARLVNARRVLTQRAAS